MLKLAAATLLALGVAALGAGRARRGGGGAGGRGGGSPGGEVCRAGARPALRIVLLGTGNPRPSPERSGPATLIEASASVSESPVRLLVAAGRGNAERLFAPR